VDPNLSKIRLEYVPLYLEDQEFWKNYFYRMVLLDTGSTTSSSLETKQESKDTKTKTVVSSSSSSSSSSASGSNSGSPVSTTLPTTQVSEVSHSDSGLDQTVYTEL